jgi:hypothetical protein
MTQCAAVRMISGEITLPVQFEVMPPRAAMIITR